MQDSSHELLLSVVSVWEIAIKRSLGRLDLDPTWARELLRLDLVQLPVTAEHARQVEVLPWHHRDPFDRLLVAQAGAEQCPLVTADARLGAYDVSILWGEAQLREEAGGASGSSKGEPAGKAEVPVLTGLIEARHRVTGLVVVGGGVLARELCSSQPGRGRSTFADAPSRLPWPGRPCSSRSRTACWLRP